jgi:proteasome accessory factor C
VPPAKTAERLRRMLAVVPYVVRNPGIHVSELSRLFGVDEDELVADLHLLLMTGLPPYTPGDLVEVDVDDEGHVWIRMADHFSKPVRLTHAEALALYLRGSELLGSPGLPQAEALRSALDKIAGVLGPEALGALTVAVEDPGHGGPLDAVRRAMDRSEEIEIDYYSASRDELTSRRVDPEQLFSALGNWYVVAWDHHADAERLFRVDRVREVRPTGQRFEPRGLVGRGRELYTMGDEDIRVRLRLAPRARWVAEYYVVDEAAERNGTVEVTLPTKDLAWVAKLVLRLGGEVEVLEPPELADLSRRLADDTLALYR